MVVFIYGEIIILVRLAAVASAVVLACDGPHWGVQKLSSRTISCVSAGVTYPRTRLAAFVRGLAILACN